MLKTKGIRLLLIGSLAASPLIALTGCEYMEENPRTSSTVIGGGVGAAAGALLGGDDNRLLGALIGGALGAGGGYLVGTTLDKSDRHHRDEMIEASRRAERNPVSPDEARAAATADVNNDGYVTLDEVVAMSRAGLGDNEMLERLRAANQFYELTQDQERYLIDRGVSRRVVADMRTINADLRDRAYAKNEYRSPGRSRDDDRYDRDHDRYDRRDDRYDRDRYQYDDRR